MPKKLKSQHSFTSGEWSPLLYSRTDSSEYLSAVKTHTNRYTDKLGPSIKRTGTKYIQDIEDETKRPRLWSFIDDDGDHVVLEFGENYVVAYENEAEVGSTLTTTYSEAEVEALSIAQHKNKIYCAVGGKNLRVITYSGAGSMSIADASYATQAPSTTQPDIVFFYQQRLCVVDSDALLIEFSQIADFGDFTTGSNADDGFTINLAMNGASLIKAVSVTRVIVVHTTSGEITIEGTGTGGYIGPPADYRIENRQTKGTNSNRTFVTGQEVLYPGRDGKQLNRFYYSFEIDAYTADTISDPAGHLFNSQIKDIAYSEISRRIFVVLTSGDVLCGTYVKERQIMAWSKFEFEGTVESVAISQNSDNEENVYFAIKRTINSSVVRYLEILETGDGSDIQHSFLDSSKTFGSTVTGATLYPIAKYKSGSVYTGGATVTSISKGAGRTALTLSASVTGNMDVGDTLIITGATGTGDLPAALNAIDHEIVQIDSGTVLWIDEDTNGVSGTLTAGTATIYPHENKTIVMSSSHTLSTSDVANIIDSGSMSTAVAAVYEGPKTVTDEHTNYFSFTDGDFTADRVGESYTISYNPQVTTVSGLSHLEGETVVVKIDGNDIGNHTVSSGSITLNSPGYLGVVGLSYTATLTTLPFDVGSPGASAMWQPSMRVNTIIHLYNSMSPTIDGNQVPVRKYEDQLDVQLPLFTGYLDYGPTKWTDDGTVTITDTSASASIITGIFGSVVGNTK